MGSPSPLTRPLASHILELSQSSPAHRRRSIHPRLRGRSGTLIQVWEFFEGHHPWPYQERDPARMECTQAQPTVGSHDELSRGNTDVGSLCLFHFSLSWGRDSDFPRSFPCYYCSKIMTAFNVKVQRVSRGIFHSDVSSVFEQRL